MKRIVVCSALLLCILFAHADDVLPRDVQQFIDKREGCDHIRGEIPESDDKRHMRDVNRQIRTLCKGTDQALLQLKKKYAGNKSVMRQLNAFEDRIEATQSPKTSRQQGNAKF